MVNCNLNRAIQILCYPIFFHKGIKEKTMYKTIMGKQPCLNTVKVVTKIVTDTLVAVDEKGTAKEIKKMGKSLHKFLKSAHKIILS